MLIANTWVGLDDLSVYLQLEYLRSVALGQAHKTGDKLVFVCLSRDIQSSRFYQSDLTKSTGTAGWNTDWEEVRRKSASKPGGTTPPPPPHVAKAPERAM